MQLPSLWRRPLSSSAPGHAVTDSENACGIVVQLDAGLKILSVDEGERAAWQSSLGCFFPDMVSMRDRVTIDLVLRAAQARTTVDTFSVIELPGGSQYMRLRMQPSSDGWLVALAPVEKKDAVYNLVVARQRYEGVMRATATGIVSLDNNRHIVDHNERFFSLLRFRSPHGVIFNEDGLRGRNLVDLCRDDSELEQLAAFLEEKDPVLAHRTTRVRRHGRILEFQEVPTRTPHFGQTGTSVLVRDVSVETELVVALEQLKLANEKLNQLATQDPLTHLLNRRGVEEALVVNSALGSRIGFHVVALIVDLDDFKAINTEHGYEGGDAVLRAVAERLTANTRTTDIVGRIGGDEFLVVLPDTDLKGAVISGEKICAAIKENPVAHRGNSISVSASLGAAELPRKVKSIKEILRLTRRTIEASKAGGKGMVSSDPTS